MIKFLALMLVFGSSGNVDSIRHNPETFDTLASCTEEITKVANSVAGMTLPDGVTKVKFVCLPLPEEILTGE